MNGYQPTEGYPTSLGKRIAAIEAEAGSALTVERLMQSLHVTGVGCPEQSNGRPQQHDAQWHDLQADFIAAAYARLSAPGSDSDEKEET